jgi:hypothetical protein
MEESKTKDTPAEQITTVGSESAGVDAPATAPREAGQEKQPAEPAKAHGGQASSPEEPSPPITTGRVISPLIAVLVCLALAEGAAIAYFYAKYYSQHLVNISIQGKLDQASATVNEQGTELARHIDALNSIKSAFVKIQAEKTNLEQGIQDKQNSISEMERRLKESLESEHAAKANLTRQVQIAAYLRKRLKESKETEMELQSRLEELTKKQTAIQARIAQLKGGESLSPGETQDIQLRETVVSETGQAATEITGQILIANDRYRFVIVNLGSDDGIEIGNQGRIENDGVPIGTATVKKLYNKMCLADIVQTSPGQRVDKKSTVKFTRAPRREGT